MRYYTDLGIGNDTYRSWTYDEAITVNIEPNIIAHMSRNFKCPACVYEQRYLTDIFRALCCMLIADHIVIRCLVKYLWFAWYNRWIIMGVFRCGVLMITFGIYFCFVTVSNI